MNKYGYFKYLDYPLKAKEGITYSLQNATMQEGSSLTQLSVGVEPYNFASFEQDAYITASPLPLLKITHELGLATNEISDANGAFSPAIILTIDFPTFFFMSGITVNCRDGIKTASIAGYRGSTKIVDVTVTDIKNNFIPAMLDGVDKVELSILELYKPYSFLVVYGIEYGRVRLFDEATVISAEMANSFSVLGDTLEYDTLDITAIDPEMGEYLLQRKQPIEYVMDGAAKNRFYIYSGETNTNNSTNILAYDEAGNLEGAFYGGYYVDYSAKRLIDDIMSNTKVDYVIEGLDNVVVNGYLPVATRRKALQSLMLGTNIRCYRSDKFVFRLADETVSSVVLDETNIVERPTITRKQPIRSLTVRYTEYSKGGGEEIDVYRGLVSRSAPQTIVFSEPAHAIVGYEITGVDENGQDIVSEMPSGNLRFIERGANHCVVICTTNNRILLKGLKFVVNKTDYTKGSLIHADDDSLENIVVETSIVSNINDVLYWLHRVYSRQVSIKFQTPENLEVGGHYNILGNELTISNKITNLTGIYEMEAV